MRSDRAPEPTPTTMHTVRCHTFTSADLRQPSHCGRASCTYIATARHMAVALAAVIDHADLIAARLRETAEVMQ